MLRETCRVLPKNILERGDRRKSRLCKTSVLLDCAGSSFSLVGEFRPVFWLTSRHAQTVREYHCFNTICDFQIIAHVLADLAFLVLRPVQWRRESVPTFDGGEVHLDWIVAPSAECATGLCDVLKLVRCQIRAVWRRVDNRGQ